MANPEIRLAVQRALDKLINRFGTQAEVIGELRAALAAIDKQTGSGQESEASTGMPPTPPEEPMAEPPPKKTPRKRSMGRNK